MGEGLTSRKVVVGCWLLASFLPVAGCSLDVPFPDGVARCGDDDDCPSGFACLDQGDGLLCYDGDESGSGGSAASGGTSGTGGSVTGGTEASGGTSSGGSPESGGTPTTGGTATGGAVNTGGTATGGMVTTGGTASGGTVTTGGNVPGNTPPEVNVLGVPDAALPNAQITVDCEAMDADNDPLTLTVQVLPGAGSLDSDTPPAKWTVPRKDGSYAVNCRADDGRGGVTNKLAQVQVQNVPPVVASVTAKPALVLWGGTSEVTCNATDANLILPSNLSFSWSDDFGNVKNMDSINTVYEVPDGAKVGDDNVKCVATDDANQTDTGAGRIRVMPSGLTTYLPFNKSLEDFAPNPAPPTVAKGTPSFAQDRLGIEASAMTFDGRTSLNFDADDVRASWTFSAWILPNAAAQSPEYLLSRSGGLVGFNGSLSLFLAPAKSATGLQVVIATATTLSQDEQPLGDPFVANGWIHLAITYSSDAGAILYLNGQESGRADIKLASSTTTFTLGASPANGYFYNGLMDDVQLYSVPYGNGVIREIMALQD